MDKRVERIKEIEKMRSELASERDKLQKEMRDENQKKEKLRREKFLGKCFKIMGTSSESYPNVIAFKILEFEKDDIQYVRCLTIVDGYRYTCWKEFGMLKQVLSLWAPDKNRLMTKSTDLKVIDMFQEISEEEFNQIKDLTINSL